MREFLIITKYNIINGLGINKLRKTKLGGSTIGLFLIFVLIVALIFLYSTGLHFIYYDTEFKKTGLNLAFLVTIVLTFIIVFPKANAFVFRTKDYEFLMSLPVKHSYVALSKLASLYFIQLFYALLIMLPILGSYFTLHPFDFVLTLIYLLLTLTIIMIPLLLSCLLAFILGFIPIKNNLKNILTTISIIAITIPLSIVYFKFIFSASQTVETPFLYFNSEFFFTKWIYEALNFKFTSLLFILAISLASILVYVLVIGINFKKINEKFSKTRKNTNFKLETANYKNNSVIKTILKKEIKTYVSLPMYIVNTITGPLLSIAGTVVLILQFPSVKPTLDSILGNSLSSEFLLIYFSISLVLFNAISPATASAISLEGKNMWIIKSSPICPKQLFLGKSLVNIIINGTIIFLDILILGIFLKANFLIIIISILIPLLYTFSSSFFSLYFNLLYPKFEFDSYVKVVKQSKAVFISTFFGLGLGILVFISSMFFMSKNPYITSLLNFGVSLFVLYLSYVLLFKDGVKRYYKL